MNLPLKISFYFCGLYADFAEMGEAIKRKKLKDDEYHYKTNSSGYHLYISSTLLTNQEKTFNKLIF